MLLTLVVALCVSVYGQSTLQMLTIKPDALSQVAPEKRARLAERMELYLRSMNAVDLDEIYASMPRSCTHGLDRSDWRKQVHVKPVGLIRAFYVNEVYVGDYTSVANVDGERWIATGCGTYQQGNKTVNYRASINLVLSGSEWYICGSGTAVEGKHNKSMRCDST